MIASWRLRGFKSIYAEEDLRLAPLTVLAGANSAGKSSVFQSILLASQSLRGAGTERPVHLNGDFVSLGTFEDVASRGAEDPTIMMGCTVDVGGKYQSRAMLDFAFRNRSKVPGSARDELELDWVHLRVSRSSSFKSGPLNSSQLLAELHIRRAEASISERKQELGVGGANADMGPCLTFEIVRLAHQFGRPKASLNQPVGSAVSQFLPIEICSVYDAVDAEAREVLKRLQQLGVPESAVGYEDTEDSVQFDAAEIEVNSRVRDILVDIVKQAAPGDEVAIAMMDDLSLRLGDLLNTFGSLPPSLRTEVGVGLARRSDELINAVKDGRTPEMRLGMFPMPLLLRAAVDAAKIELNGVRYLGPLREAPRSMYPFLRGADETDVGVHGEFTAAVLDLLGEQPISYVSPGSLHSEIETVEKDVRLIDAVNDWIRYLEVGTEGMHVDQVKYGYVVGAVGNGGWKFDMSHFGVGVSQVLPVLVLGLLAPAGTTMIFEQPEVHLNPSVQARLADFFVTMTWLKKQCLIETHSEHLVNGIRLRASKQPADRVADRTLFYFVERNGASSQYRPVIVNTFGNLPDWPK